MSSKSSTGSRPEKPEHVNQVNEEPRAFDMFQKFHSEAGARVRTFNETRNIGYDKALELLRLNDTEIGDESRKRIIDAIFGRAAEEFSK